MLDKKNTIYLILIGIALGLYDGMFGPGGGTIAMLLLSVIMKYDMRSGCANGKIIVLVSNFVALSGYIATNNVIYSIAIPAAIFNALGAYIGASLAIKNGNRLILPIMFCVVTVLMARYLFL